MNAPHTLVFGRHYTDAEQATILSRYAAVFDAITGGQTHFAGVIDGRVLRGMAAQGLITAADPRSVTALGTRWRDGFTGPVAPLSTLTVRKPKHGNTKANKALRDRLTNRVPVVTPKAKPTAKPKRAPKPATVARDLMAAGLVFVHPKLIDDLSTEELALWIKAKRHERDGLTLAALAALLGEPLAHVRIRAERIVAKGYVVAVRDEEAA
jgi:hypothetical protein